MTWVTARAPVRVDFTGGYTDVEPFCDEVVGRTVNLAVSLHAQAEGCLRPDRRVVIDFTDLDVRIDVADIAQLPGATPSRLTETILAEQLDGAGISLRIRSDAPFGSGLGGSGAMSVALLALLHTLHGRSVDRASLPVAAGALERRSGIVGGLQDQVAAVFGGAHHLEFRGAACTAEPLRVGARIRAALRERFLLLHPGGTRASTALVGPIMERFRQGDAATTRALVALNDTAGEVRASLLADDPEALTAGLGRVAARQRAVDPAIAGETVSRLEAALGRSSLTCVKPLGAGGSSSCVLVGHRPNRRAAVLRHALEQGFRVLPIEAESVGLSLVAARTEMATPRGSS